MAAKDAGDLLREARAGNRVARQQLVLRHHAALLALVRADLSSALRAHLDAEDVLQEVYTAVLEGFDSFGGNTSEAFTHWLHAIARNKVAEVHRRYLHTDKRDARLEQRNLGSPFSQTTASLTAALEARMTTVAGRVVRVEALDALAAALALLPAHYRQVIELRYLQDLSVEETARQVGRTRGSVLMISHRAMAEIAATLKQFPLLTRG